MPVYNTMPYLTQSICSVQAQTLQDWELLVIDDGSTDGSGEEAEQFAAKDPRIRVFHQPNSGISAARNKALSLVRGKYIGFVDADDLLQPTMYETMVQAAEANNCEIVSVGHISFDDDSVLGTSYLSLPPEQVLTRDDIVRFIPDLSQKKTFLYIWRRLFCADLIRANNIRFDPAISVGEDTIFCLECFLHAQRTIALHQALYMYRHRPGSAMRSDAFRPNYLPSLDLGYQQKVKLCLPHIPGQESLFLHNLASHNRTFLNSVMLNFFRDPHCGLRAFRKMFRRVMMRDMLRCLDWKQERSRSLDSVMLQLVRFHMFIPAYFLAKKIFGQK